MNKLFAVLMLCIAPLAAWGAQAADDGRPDTPILDGALKTAAVRKAPVLVDFQAPWCYSCYYMARHVLVGPDWQRIEHQAVVVDMDADSPEGAYWKARWGVKALPSYVILNSEGSELGRILAEQRPAEFYARVGEILARSSTLDDLRAAAAAGGPEGLKAARTALQVYRARYDESGITWYRSLPATLHGAYDADADIALTLARLELLRASKARDAVACESIAPNVLQGDLGCERPYEIDRWRNCSEGLPADERKAVLKSQLPLMQKLVDQHVFGKGPLCADQRSAVLGLADVYDGLERKPEAHALIRKAIDRAEKMAAGNLADDRNLADNWRVYLEALEDDAGMDLLYPKLIAAYPLDYVYPFRYGRHLLALGHAAKALPYLERAATTAYGQNRLKVAEQRVKALRLLHREDEARQVVAEALKANGPWFPEDAAKLKALL